MTALTASFRSRRSGDRHRIAYLAALAVVSCATVTNASSLYDHASYAPANVTMSIHVEDAATLRANLAARPITAVWARTLQRQVGPAWSKLARSAGTTETELFDRVLGRRCSLFFTGTGIDRDWALVTDVEASAIRPILLALEPEVRAPIQGLRAGVIPEHDVRFAALGETMLVGPRAGVLFDHMARRLAQRTAPDDGPAFAKMPWIAQARKLTPASVGVFVQHEDALGGGWSIFSGAIAGDRVDIRHAARFDVAPFERPRTQLTWDMSPLLAVEDNAVLAVIEPTDIGGGPWIRFIEVMLDEPLLTAAMRRNMDESMMVCVAEIEGRQEPHGTDMLLPAAALVIKAREGDTALRELDECVVRVVQAADRLVEGPFVREMPAFDAAGFRHLDLEPGMAELAHGFPVLRSTSLDWTVARGPNGDYYVLATHADHLRATVAALEAQQRTPGCRGPFTSCGVVNGVAIGRQLESYGEQAALFTGDAPDARDAFHATMLDLATLARGIDRCQWRLARPSDLETDLRLELTLRAADSAGRPGAPR